MITICSEVKCFVAGVCPLQICIYQLFITVNWYIVVCFPISLCRTMFTASAIFCWGVDFVHVASSKLGICFVFFCSIILNYLPPSNLPPSNSWFPGFVDVWLTSKAVLVSIICHLQRRNSVESSINTWVFVDVFFGFGDDDLIMI